MKTVSIYPDYFTRNICNTPGWCICQERLKMFVAFGIRVFKKEKFPASAVSLLSISILSQRDDNRQKIFSGTVIFSL